MRQDGLTTLLRHDSLTNLFAASSESGEFACCVKKKFSENLVSGRLVTCISDESIEKVRKLIILDSQLTVLMKVDEMQIKRKSVRQIITLNLGMRKTCYRY
ncbi:hypothetical protein TNCV_3254371 [Trichonephila clavipes]|nr:hypothetical protein TNCV_3254371 [Trichonephila clavipes]